MDKQRLLYFMYKDRHPFRKFAKILKRIPRVFLLVCTKPSEYPHYESPFSFVFFKAAVS